MSNRARKAAVFLGSISGTSLTVPIVRGRLRRQGLLDRPNSRSSHSVPTPRGGGLACAFGGLLGASIAALAQTPVAGSWLFTSASLAAVGRTDDQYGLSPLTRLGVQVSTGAIIGLRSGGVTGLAVGMLTVPVVVNAFNFMDGINGISGGTAAAWGFCVAGDILQASHVRTQALLTAGMALGFVPYNVPDASIFLGDVGSYLLGGGISASVISSAFVSGEFAPKIAARTVAPLTPYLVDTGSTIIRRAVRGESLTEAHREHAYQRLVQVTGFDHWKVAAFASVAAVVCGLASRSRFGWCATLSVGCLYLAAPKLGSWAGGDGRQFVDR